MPDPKVGKFLKQWAPAPRPDAAPLPGPAIQFQGPGLESMDHDEAQLQRRRQPDEDQYCQGSMC